MQELPAAELIREICEVTGYREKVPGAAGGRDRGGQPAAAAGPCTAELTGRPWRSDFAEYLRRLASGAVCCPAAAGGDAVTVTTIHRSKGLEYRWCSGYWELGFACKLRDNYTMLQHKTLPLAGHALQNRKTRLQEEMRILYVGLTRAREKAVPDGYGVQDHRRAGGAGDDSRGKRGIPGRRRGEQLGLAAGHRDAGAGAWSWDHTAGGAAAAGE